jgi:hypothetical protein
MRQSLLLFISSSGGAVAPWRRWVVWGMALLVLAGCGSKAPTPEGFRHVLQAYFDNHPICLSVAFKLPADVRAADTVFRAPLDALVGAGLARVQTSQHQEISTFSGAARTVDMRHYELTDTGRKAVRPGRDRFLGGSQVCFARTEIIAVDTISPPPDRALTAGQARVTFRYRLTDVASWTQHADVRATMPGIGDMLASNSGTVTDTLTLSDNGWMRPDSQPFP